MIEGIFAYKTPYIRIRIANGEAFQYEWFALDTGFSGELHISSSLAKKLNLRPRVANTFVMANGRFERFLSTRIMASLESKSRELNVLISDGNALAGIGFLQKFNLRAILDGRYKTLHFMYS